MPRRSIWARGWRVDNVLTWSGAVDSAVIADLASRRPQYPLNPNDADCGGGDEPPPIDDL